MSLEQTINTAIVTAMKEKDKVALDSLRAVKSQILLAKQKVKVQKFQRNKKLQFCKE